VGVTRSSVAYCGRCDHRIRRKRPPLEAPDAGWVLVSQVAGLSKSCGKRWVPASAIHGMDQRTSSNETASTQVCPLPVKTMPKEMPVLDSGTVNSILKVCHASVAMG